MNSWLLMPLVRLSHSQSSRWGLDQVNPYHQPRSWLRSLNCICNGIGRANTTARKWHCTDETKSVKYDSVNSVPPPLQPTTGQTFQPFWFLLSCPKWSCMCGHVVYSHQCVQNYILPDITNLRNVVARHLPTNFHPRPTASTNATNIPDCRNSVLWTSVLVNK